MMQAAAVSGLDLAARLGGLRGVAMEEAALAPHRIGLDTAKDYGALRGTEIGQFPH